MGIRPGKRLGVNIGFLSVVFAAALTIGALAVKPMIENSASGVVLVARPAFTVGDQIKTKEYRGIVEEIGSRSTRLRQSDGIVVYVSNNQVLGNPILVYTERDCRKGSFEVSVGADNDLDHLTSVLMAAITSVDNVVADPAPAVQATGLQDKAATLEISYSYPSTEESGSTVTDGVIRATLTALRQADIERAAPDAKITEEPVSANGHSAAAPSDDHTTGAATESDDVSRVPESRFRRGADRSAADQPEGARSVSSTCGHLETVRAGDEVDSMPINGTNSTSISQPNFPGPLTSGRMKMSTTVYIHEMNSGMAKTIKKKSQNAIFGRPFPLSLDLRPPIGSRRILALPMYERSNRRASRIRHLPGQSLERG